MGFIEYDSVNEQERFNKSSRCYEDHDKLTLSDGAQ